MITATQYIFRASVPTATTATSVGGYTVPASTRAQIVAVTVANTAATNLTTFADIGLSDGSTTYPLVTRAAIYPGGNLIVEGVAKHVLPTGGSVEVVAYSTNISVVMTAVEITAT